MDHQISELGRIAAATIRFQSKICFPGRQLPRINDRLIQFDQGNCKLVMRNIFYHIDGNRELVAERLGRVMEAIGERPLSAFEVVPHVFGDSLSQQNAHWLLSKILCYLTHLQALGEVRRIPGEPERWAA